MSPSIKLGLLTLASTAAAIPHYGHSRFHKPSGGYGGPGTSGPAYPTGGWPDSYNSTAVGPTGTPVHDSKTTTILETDHSAATIVSTIYAMKPSAGGEGGYEAPSSVGAEDMSTGAAACGPATIYVTATNKVTITVPAGGASAPSSAYTPSIAVPESSAASEASTPGGGYEAPSSIVTEGYGGPHKPKTSSAVIPESTPGQMSILPYTSAPIESAPATSVIPVYTSVTSEVPVHTPASSEAAPSSAAPSSAAPSPSTPAHSGGKRGLAYTDASLCKDFAGSASWAYDWGANGGDDLPEGIKYVPQMHKPADMTPEKWLEAVETAVGKGSDTVMGFNEPDHPEQANLSPQDACTQWTNYMEPVAKNHPSVTILGPSVTNGGAPMGFAWLTAFKEACPSATWQGVNIHFYDQYDDQVVQRFKDHCEEAAKTYGKKVWVTEFGLNPGTASDEQAASFLKEVIAYMDGSDNIAGYAYFMVGSGQYQLNSGTGLSGTGEVYNS